MYLTRMALPRRTFLRGLGATLALPLLDAMVPALTAVARTAAAPVRRLGFTYVPNGMAMNKAVNYWRPKGEGGAFELSPILTPLAAFKDHLTVVSGLSHRQAEAFSDGGGDHSRASASWLSGVHPKQAEGADVRAAMTVDQIAADLLGKDTQLPSLELSIDRDDLVGNCDNGYSCVYVNTLSWRTPTTPLPPENNPAVVFERLFGDGGTVAHRLAENRKDRSILDALTEDIAGLQRALGPGGSAPGRRISGCGPRDRAAHSEEREADRRIDIDDAGSPDRHSAGLWRTRQADVRPAVAGLSGRRDAGLHVHARPRARRPLLSRARGAGEPPRAVASPRRHRQPREAVPHQHLSRRAVLVFRQQAGLDA